MKNALLTVALLTTSFTVAASTLSVDVRARAPEMIVEGNKVEGPIIEIIKEAAEKNGLKLKYRKRPFGGSLELMSQGKTDMIPRTLCTSERAKMIDYLGPIGYQEKPIVFFVEKGREGTIKSVDDLKNIKVGVKAKTVYTPELDDDRGIRKISAPDDPNLVKMLTAGRFDAIASFDKGSTEQAFADAGITEFAIADFQFDQYIGNYYGIRKNLDSKDALQATLEEMVISGRVAEIYTAAGVEAPVYDESLGFAACK